MKVQVSTLGEMGRNGMGRLRRGDRVDIKEMVERGDT